MSTPPDTQPASNFQNILWMILRNLRTVLLILAAIFQDILVETMPEYIKTPLEKSLKNYPYLWPITIGIIVIIFLVSDITKFKKKGSNEAEPAKLTDKERAKFIALLKNRYDKRKEQKVADKPELKLSMRYTTEGPALTHFLKSEALTNERATATLNKLLQQHQHLLVLGEPGCGKTNSLLNLAVDLLKTASTDDKAPVPVIFNLAGWEDPAISLNEWMKQVLQHGHSVPANLAASLLMENKLVILLDGLDEIGLRFANADKSAALQQQCLEGIGQFVTNYPLTKLVICSRRKEYERAGGKAQVKAQLLIELADWHTVEQRLVKIKKDSTPDNSEQGAYYAAANVLALVQEHPSLKTVLCIPFYYNAALQSLYKKEDITNIDFVVYSDAIKGQLEALYINRTLRSSKYPKYPAEKIHHWLSWLAHWQQHRSSTSFELGSFGAGSLYLSMMELIVHQRILFLIFGLAHCLAFWLFGGWIYGLVGFIMGGFLGIQKLKTPVSKRIITKEIAMPNLKLLFSKNFLIAFGLGFIFCWWNSETLITSRSWVSGLLGGLFVGVYFGLPKVNVTESINPVKSLFSGLKILSQLFTLTFCIFYVSFCLNLPNSFIKEFVLPLMYWTGVFLLLKADPLLQFISLQYTLYHLGHLPFRMAHFFDYCANELHLLEKDTGGSWRFRHQIIQDYFLQQYCNDNPVIDEAS
jgi:DNA polymerase III delta prime subunit